MAWRGVPAALASVGLVIPGGKEGPILGLGDRVFSASAGFATGRGEVCTWPGSAGPMNTGAATSGWGVGVSATGAAGAWAGPGAELEGAGAVPVRGLPRVTVSRGDSSWDPREDLDSVGLALPSLGDVTSSLLLLL